MGIVIREYRCGDCSHQFESSEPVEEVVCPACTSAEAEREFRTAPGIKSPNTTRSDTIVKELAAHHGLSDVSNKYGESVMSRHGQRGPQQSHARWDGSGQTVLNAIPQQHRDSFSQMGRFGAPKPQYVGKVKSS